MAPIIARHFYDLFHDLGSDPGIEPVVNETIEWICCAQDHSKSKDGGVASHYSSLTGWGFSYPETTGYIIPTIIGIAKRRHDKILMHRARKMLDWLLKIQLPSGGFQGGTIDSAPVVPVVFNSGQILFGLASGAVEFGEPYLASMRRAAEWLVSVQDDDGCWRMHPSPFTVSGEKVYDTSIAWALMEASIAGGIKTYYNAAIKNVHWALTKQRENGWFADCCMNDPARPLTHTIGYALRGIIEMYRHTKDPVLLDASHRTGKGLLRVIKKNGFLSGRLDAEWNSVVPWSCLTGSVQIALCLLVLYQETKDISFREAAFALNRYVRKTVRLDGPLETRGAVAGSFPASGNYGRYEYPNWAAKFFVDSNLYEQIIREQSRIC